MVSIQPALLLVQLLTFGGAVFLLWKFFWKPLNRFMKNRSDRIEYDIRSAGELKTEAESLKRNWDKQMVEAEAKRMLDDAGDRIAEERRRTARELRTETVTLAMLIAERALKQSVEPTVQERLVKEFAERLRND